MFLSKVFIPWSYSKNPYNLHCTIWQLFPDMADSKRDFLFRIEKTEKNIGVHILLLSIKEPTAGASNIQLLTSKPLSYQFNQGQKLRFHLRANPVKTIKDVQRGTYTRKGKTYTKTCRVPLTKEEEQKMWLVRKLKQSVNIEFQLVQPEPVLYFRKEKENRSGKIQPVLFDGILTVIDTQLFTDLIANGIGHAKAFGCGLLSVAKV
jgi:CRISPR system Cascade subunit CasE